jgi:hypothetical protein
MIPVMPSKRPIALVSRALSAAGLVAVTAFVVIRSGSSEAPSRSAVPTATPRAAPGPIAATQPPLPHFEPIAEPPAPEQASAQSAPGQLSAARPALPVDESPRAQMERACEQAAARLRPLPFGTDEQNLGAAAAFRELDALGQRLRDRRGQLQPSQAPPIECPEDLLRSYFEGGIDTEKRFREQVDR